MNQLGAVERRRRNLRILLFVIILGTLPLYCLGFLLWGTAPQRTVRTLTPQPLTAQSTFEASATNVPFATFIPFPTLNIVVPPTSQPFQPPVIIPPTSVPFFPTATFFNFPTSTNAPTLTPFPTITPFPSDTPIPIPSETPIPIPSDTPIPVYTDTATPTPTGTPTETVIPFS